jgi:DNA-binding transcriptional LysR family regulator
LTPAAITQRIRVLEDEIGTRLLIRSGRTVTTTEAGAAILVRSRNVLVEIRDLKSLAADSTLSGELRLGAVPSSTGGFLPDALKGMMQKHPRVVFSLTRGQAPDLYRRITRGELDAAIIAAPPFTIPKSCGWRTLVEEPFVLLRLILRQEPFIRQPRNGWTGRIVDAYLRKLNIRPRHRFEAPGIAEIAVLVDRGVGVSIVPDSRVHWPEGLSVRKTPFRDKSFLRRIGLVWAQASARTRLVRAFLDEVNAVLAHAHPSRRSSPRTPQ